MVAADEARPTWGVIDLVSRLVLGISGLIIRLVGFISVRIAPP